MRQAYYLMAASLAAATFPSTQLEAADHVDAPSVIADPAADITDIYAWSDGPHVNLILNIVGPAAFSDVVQYVFHVESQPAFGMPGQESTILCTFDAAQQISCWLDDQVFVTGNPSDPAGLEDAEGRLRVFAGRRDDPFFFNQSGFNATIAAVAAAAPSLSFDGSGCPSLDSTTSNALVTQLRQEPEGTPAEDDFAGGSVLSLVLQVERDLLDRGGSILGIWASTRR